MKTEAQKKAWKAEYNKAYAARKRAENKDAKPLPPSRSKEKQRVYQARWAAKKKAEREAAEAAPPKRNGKKNGHAVEVWKPGKGSISVPSILQAHGHAPRSASHAALVERALGLIEAGLVLVSEELRRK